MDYDKEKVYGMWATLMDPFELFGNISFNMRELTPRISYNARNDVHIIGELKANWVFDRDCGHMFYIKHQG